MTDVSEVLKRKSDRQSALKHLYEFWHANDGSVIRMDKDDVGKARYLAFIYLADKGLIELKLINNFLLEMKITANGIDVVESEIQ